MRVDGLQLREGTSVNNLTCPSGSELPDKPSDGELFRLKAHKVLPDGLYSYEDGGWELLAKVEPMIEVGTTYELDINTSRVIAINWNRVYAISTKAFEVVDGTKIRIKMSGTYEIYYNISIESIVKAKARSIALYVRLASGYIFNRSRSYQFTSDGADNTKSSSSIKFSTPLNVGEELQLCGQRLGAAGQAFAISDNCSFGIRRIGK